MIFKSSKTQRLAAFLGSNRFWAIVLGVFVFQTVWIALTARYPQAFDEQFHFGIIKLYAHHLSPFWSGQPIDVGQFGAITRDPSYMYQYLMSFPFRLISAFTSSETAQVVCLRLLNVTMLTAAVVIFRRVLGQLGASLRMRNVVMAFFVLTPVVPLLGAQINYDNLVMLVTAVAFSLYVSFRRKVREHATWNWTRLTQLLLICLFASLVKYAFLPLAFGLALAVLFDWRFARKKKQSVMPKKGTSKLTTLTVIYGVLLVIGVGLFSQRYIVNTVQYHTPIPECDQVLSVAQCEGYAPWARNYMFASWHLHLTHQQIITYPFVWMRRALGETVFSITSLFNAKGTVDYHTGLQLPVTNVLSWIVFVGGGLLSFWYWKYIRAQKELTVLMGVSGIYFLALFGQNFMDYLHLGLPVAIHGRYLLPILPLLYLSIALAVGRCSEDISKTQKLAGTRKAVLAAAVLVIFVIEGGGFVTGIVRSDASWFWPQIRAAQLVNQYAQDVLKHIVIR